MKSEKIANRCLKCQAELPSNAPQGLCPKCLLAAAATPTEAGQSPRKTPPPSLASVAEAFPNLEIIELIGQGGMGLVYKARQPKLDRFVALKLLPQSLAVDPAFAERFNREARVLARLNHPNIVTIFDFGQAGGFFYLLMEYVDGVNLRQAMLAGRFTPEQAMLLVPRICEALQFAHDEGILHRDIKPENILLDTRGRVKIADFGIAKLVGDGGEKVTLTSSSVAVGTPHYMAPEQLEHPHDVDQRADIYSLGVVFYEMLTGELPIGRFAPPSAKSAVDRRVDDLVFHALEKEREKRFHTATEVKNGVEALTAGAGATVRQGAAVPPATGAGQAAGSESRATCYYNTPQKMADCWPSAAARVFTCKGELVLEATELVFVSPWRTMIRIPLKSIEDLSVGQFQMWTTPWVAKYARLNFLSVSYWQDGKLQTVHLTPVPLEATSANQVNQYVGRWFERLQSAAKDHAGAIPRASAPEWVTVSAEPAWNKKGLPVTIGFGVTSLAAWILLPQRSVPMPFALLALMTSVLLLTAALWFCLGFLRANRALWRADLDAVTSDEAPTTEVGRCMPPLDRRRRLRLASLSFLGVLGAGLIIPIGMLLWEAWVFPSFGQRIFGERAVEPAETSLVLETLWQSPSPTAGDASEPGKGAWAFKCQLPERRLAHILFVRWTNGVATLEAALSTYFKTGSTPQDVDLLFSCEPHQEPGSSATNMLLWQVNLDGENAKTLMPFKQSARLRATQARAVVQIGHQRAIRLMEDPDPEGVQHAVRDGVELRLLLEPLRSPAVRNLPSEKQLGDCIGGVGLDLPPEELLKLIQRRPKDS